MGYTAEETSDNGMIVCGSFTTGFDDSIWVLKFDSFGRIEWEKQFAPPNKQAIYPNHFNVKQDNDGTYILLANIIAPNLTNPNQANILIMRLDTQGNPVWAKVLGLNQQELQLYDDIQTSKDGYVFVAVTKVNNNSYTVLIKLNKTGKLSSPPVLLGNGIQDYQGQHMSSPDSDGNVYISGRIRKGVNENLWVSKFNIESNTFKWQKEYFGISGNLKTYPSPIVMTPDYGFLVGANTDLVTSGSSAFYILKGNPQGGVEWARLFNALTSNVKSIDSMQQQEQYLLAGSTMAYGNNSQGFNVILSKQGKSLFGHTFGGENIDRINSAKYRIDGGISMTGSTSGSRPTGTFDFLIIKTDINGNIPEPNCGVLFDNIMTSISATTRPKNTTALVSTIELVILDFMIEAIDTSAPQTMLCSNLVQPPINVQLEVKENKSLFRSEEYHHLSWGPNTYNEKFQILEYRVYSGSLAAGTDFQSVPYGTFSIQIGPVAPDWNAVYAITTVDTDGIESAAAVISLN